MTACGSLAGAAIASTRAIRMSCIASSSAPSTPSRSLAARASSSLAGRSARGTLTAAKSAVRRDRGRGRDGCRGARQTEALVSVDLGPAVVLGSALMVSAVALYQVRASRPEVSRDKDVFFSSIGLLCGGILIFQGWRLDPLMLFGQLLTTATAVAFATETISLRQELLDAEDAREFTGKSRPGRGRQGRRSKRVRSLPPVQNRDVDLRVDYGSKREYGRDEAFDYDATVFTAKSDLGGAAYGAQRSAANDRYDAYGDATNDFDRRAPDEADEASPYRDGFRSAAGESPPKPRPSTDKNWENDDWDFV